MADNERRRALRVPVEMWVEESNDRELYFQRSANLSIGGMFLENTVPHPVGTVITIRFTLPGDSVRIEVRAEIVNAADSSEQGLGMGLKFIDLKPEIEERLRTFIAARGLH
jgi:uncharacterized protein (TIGR02266 family)